MVKEGPRISAYLLQSQENTVDVSWLWAMLFAFLGGLLLNLMPCVLPVLSIKVLSMVELGGSGSRKDSFLHGLIMTTGVILSFLILAGLLMILKQAGLKIGWGFQLQSPVFVLIMAVVLFIFAFNLLGVFEIGISLTRAGNISHKNPHMNSFLTGVFATVVATPCTAPFMGTALAVALGQPVMIALAIFFFLGLGMAAPYLVLATFPGWLRFLPRPGSWMQTMKEVMAFPLFATIVWLLWLLGRQSGNNAIALSLIVLLLCGLAMYLVSKGFRKVGFAFILSLLVILLSVPALRAILVTKENSQVNMKGDELFEQYSSELIHQLEKNRQKYFLDFTADWCLSCKVNESIAFTDEVLLTLKNKNVMLIKADWTDYNPEITEALESYGRNSIPLYIYFDGNERVVLPEIITSGILMKAINAEPRG